ncbi:hypothetical protein AGLY_017020 [Aphis glycines]|uniref:Uncharacterized protein n=1 Tax=Aphis glycines TaxID=307491 RepID=A0A6G0SWS0_APHGL|nr:hypothetical protein AGLY_017020 [Aphis glycines]
MKEASGISNLSDVVFCLLSFWRFRLIREFEIKLIFDVESELIFEELVLGWSKSFNEVVDWLFKFSVIGYSERSDECIDFTMIGGKNLKKVTEKREFLRKSDFRQKQKFNFTVTQKLITILKCKTRFFVSFSTFIKKKNVYKKVKLYFYDRLNFIILQYWIFTRFLMSLFCWNSKTNCENFD